MAFVHMPGICPSLLLYAAVWLLLCIAPVASQCPRPGLNVSNSCWYVTKTNANCTGYCQSVNLTYVKVSTTARLCSQVLQAYDPLRYRMNATLGNGSRGCYWAMDTQTLHYDGELDPDLNVGAKNIQFCTCAKPPFKAVWNFQNIWCAVVVIVLFIFLAFELWTAEFLLFSAALILFLSGIITINQLVQGFSNQGILTVAVLYICVRPLNDLRLLRILIHRYILVSPKKPRITLAVLFGSLGFLSFWLNNTPIVAMIIPFIKDWCREHNVAPSRYLLPVSYAAIFGGVCTVIGTSTNLVIQGFLQRDGEPEIAFFEVGVAGGFLLFGVGWIYVTLLGPILLPKRGGLLRMAREHGAEFLLQLEVTASSPLVGKPVNKLKSRLPRSEQHRVQLVEIIRQEGPDDVQAIFPLAGSEILHARDRLILSGHVQAIVSSIVATPGLRLIADDTPGNPLHTLQHVEEEDNVHHLFNEHMPLNSPVIQNTPAGIPGEDDTNCTPRVPEDGLQELGAHICDSSADDNCSKRSDSSDKHAQPNNAVEFYEVTLSRGCPALGFTIGSGEFQRFYQATIVAVRPAHGGDHLGREMEGITLDVGDSLLILAREQFYATWAKSTHFFVVAHSGMTPDDIPDDHFYVNLPHWVPRWCCLSHLQHRATRHVGRQYMSVSDTLTETQQTEIKEKQIQRINIPWWPYISVASFIAMVTIAASGLYDILPCAFCNAIFIIAIGILTPQQAIESIDASVYIMVAASFGIGLALEVSGLAANLASLTLTKLTDPWSLTIVTALITTFATAVVTNNASAAIIYPLAANTAKQMGIPVKPLAVIVAVASSIDFATPFGYQCNLMVRGPGGYRCVDYAKFGLILNFVCPILLAVNVCLYYGL